MTYSSNLTASSRDTCNGQFFIGMDNIFVCSTFGSEQYSTFKHGHPNDGQVGVEVNGKTASTYYNLSALEFSLLSQCLTQASEGRINSFELTGSDVLI